MPFMFFVNQGKADKGLRNAKHNAIKGSANFFSSIPTEASGFIKSS
jgi:hypothetical protein